MIEELREKDMKQGLDREKQILEKIKAKMDRIKATQQKVLEPIQEPITHGQGNTSDSISSIFLFPYFISFLLNERFFIFIPVNFCDFFI